MEYAVIGIIGAAIIAVGVIFFIKMRKKPANKSQDSTQLLPQEKKSELVSSNESLNELVIQMEKLPVEKIPAQNKLVEIKDNKVLAHVNNLIPEIAQVRTSAHSAAKAVEKSGEVLYRAIIPTGAKLVDSRDMAGAFRGFCRDENNIVKHANLVAVQAEKGTEVLSNVASSAMGVASMIVGQYYMEQINNQLGAISDGISKISDFQNNEYRSRVFSLVAHIKNIADFQIEILENDELRLSKISQLDGLEEECTQLLGQANLTLADYTQKNDLNYVAYEKEVIEVQNWYAYQKALTDVLYRISELKYTLHMGAVSREQCGAMLPTYTNQVAETQMRLTEWHQQTAKRLKIDMVETRRKRDGFDGVIHFVPGLFNDNLNFRSIEAGTAEMIQTQSEGKQVTYEHDTSDLYSEDVQLIIKDDKIYYLPANESDI